jgi:hypothetical protein
VVPGTMACRDRNELKKNGMAGELDALISWFAQHLLN